MALLADEIAARRDEIVRAHGPWTNYNLDLGGVWTIGPDASGIAEQRVQRVVQAVRDAVSKPLSEARVLDLACYEGAFAIAFAKQGAEVVGIDARTEHVVKSRFAAEALGLDVTFEQDDVRNLSRAHGAFDVVLCLGILYHLDAPDCFEFLQRVADVCSELTVIETQVALSGGRTETWRGEEFRGRSYPEDPAMPGAAADNRESFWPTRSSLLNALGDVGFTSISELLVPVIPELARFSDHTTLLAWKGDRIGSSQRWPERLIRTAHPTQGLRYRLLDWALGRRGSGMQRIFSKRGS